MSLMLITGSFLGPALSAGLFLCFFFLLAVGAYRTVSYFVGRRVAVVVTVLVAAGGLYVAFGIFMGGWAKGRDLKRYQKLRGKVQQTLEVVRLLAKEAQRKSADDAHARPPLKGLMEGRDVFTDWPTPTVGGRAEYLYTLYWLGEGSDAAPNHFMLYAWPARKPDFGYLVNRQALFCMTDDGIFAGVSIYGDGHAYVGLENPPPPTLYTPPNAVP